MGPSKSVHVKSLTGQTPGTKSAFGSITSLDAGSFPILERLSIRRLLLAPSAVREPHWHANGNELGYCLRGQVLVTIAGNHSRRDTFTISPGEMFFIPSGEMHHIENIGTEEAEFILAFSNERPEDFGLSGTFGCMTDAVLGNTFGLPAAQFAALPRSAQDVHFAALPQGSPPEIAARHINPYKLSLEAAQAPISSPAGSAHTAKGDVWPVLKDIAMFSVHVSDAGMREVHWHPQTAEMGFVVQGQARMTVLSPGGNVDTYELKPGDVYFIPRAYPHHIEDIGSGDIHFLIFFDQAIPADIGAKSMVSCYAPEVVAATFGVNVANLPDFPFTAADPLIVPRVNPVDK